MKAGKTKNDIYFMQEAIRLATVHMTAGDGGPFGAVIVKDNKIVARGWNRVTSTNDPTAHAEVDCIRKASATLQTFDLSGCTLYANCEPCPMCLAAAYWAKIDRIYFAADKTDAAQAGFNDAMIYQELQKKREHRTLPLKQLLRDEALQTFSLWKQLEEKILY